MEMGLNNSSEANMKREPDFTDDCYFRVPGCDKEREEFFKLLHKEKKLSNQNKVIEYQEQTRTIETIMYICLQKLFQRSFDYNVLVNELRNENLVTDEKQKLLRETFLTTLARNFEVIEESTIHTEIIMLKDGEYNVWTLRFKKMRPSGETKIMKERTQENTGRNNTGSTGTDERFNEEETTTSTGNENNYLCYTLYEETVKAPDVQEDETLHNQQGDQPEENNESATISENSQHETRNKSATPDTNRKEESKDSEADDFEKLLQQEIDGAKVQDEKIRELNEKIGQQKVKMEEDKKNADQKIEAEAREFEENIKKAEKKFREAEKQKQKLNDEDMKKRRKKREEYERETEKIRQEHMKELHNFVAGFYECIKLKMRWELKEDEWVDWLKTLRSLVARARNQFLSFEASFGSYGVEDVESRRWAEEDLQKLHHEVLSTHEELYRAYFFIKDLSSQHSDRTFLSILQNLLSKICGSLLTVLQGIDGTKIEEENCLENLRTLFSKFDSSDIYYTSELRKLDREQDLEKYKNIEDPEKYEPKSEEMAESAENIEKESVNLEHSSVGSERGSENREVSESVVEKSTVDQAGVVTESENCGDEKQTNPKNDEDEENKNKDT